MKIYNIGVYEPKKNINLTPKENVVFKGITETDGQKKENTGFFDLFKRAKDVKLSAQELDFLKTYEEKELEIKEKYDKQIAQIKDGFWDKWFSISEKKRNKLRNQRNKDLQVAYQFQILFEQREEELTQLKLEQLKMAQELNLQSETIIALSQMLQQSKLRQEINKSREKKLEDRGFTKIAGYNEEKMKLKECFIDRLDYERAGEKVSGIPNAILFFGPTGCGKTTFAEALAQEADCNFVKLNCTRENREQQFIDKLNGYNEIDEFGDEIKHMGILDKAQNSFLKTSKRTIILVDEFDRFFNNNTSTRFINGLKNIMDKCSEDYHVTFFLTTNNPQRIPYELLNSHRTGLIVNLDPPNEDNVMSVIGYYLNDYNTDNVDYDKVLTRLLKYAPDEVYSNSHLKSICENIIDENLVTDEEITTDMVLAAIENHDNSSENKDLVRITKSYLDKYEDDKEKVGVL